MKYLLALAMTSGLLAGCHTPSLADIGPRYHPANVHTVPVLPKSICRVALLPIATHRNSTVLQSGVEQTSPVLEAELRKTARFELVVVSLSQLQAWTGRSSWRADEALPIDLFDRIKSECAVDAVLLPTLTEWRPYPPVAVGLDLRLVGCGNHETTWAVDELIDAGAESVARSARDYGRAHFPGKDNDGADSVLHSPARFARFACAELLATLPSTQQLAKLPGKDVDAVKQERH